MAPASDPPETVRQGMMYLSVILRILARQDKPGYWREMWLRISCGFDEIQ